ncbi:MAG: lycopene cyclase domain-containing protein [Bacteroidetes bacterium]|nr:MAG: lycopene cyclase domain-containing protein [Bacteroidota bacterium]
MLKQYTYLLIDLLAISVPFIFSFHPKIQFHKVWKSFFPSVIISGIIFLMGDALYTHLGVWGFNPDYLTGIQVGNLPLEEVLFFFCIPYACVFSYHCFDRLVDFKKYEQIKKWLGPGIIAFSAVLSVIYYDRLYTFAACAGLVLMLIMVQYWFKVKWLSKFFIVYAFLLIPFLMVNGLLTGTGLAEPIVWYDDNENMGLRILSIPFEDLFYGMSMILMNVFGFEILNARNPVSLSKVA